MSFLSSKSSPFDNDVEKATSEYSTSEDWQLIMDLCDKIKCAPSSSKDALRAIMKRVNHRVPHVAMQALTNLFKSHRRSKQCSAIDLSMVLSACVNNCDKKFLLEICSRDWTSDARQIINRAHPTVQEKFKGLIQQWADDFKDDPQLSLMPVFYKKLKSEGVDFPSKGGAAGTSAPSTSKAKKDELSFKEDIDLAIALSLQDAESSNKQPTTSKLYPDVSSKQRSPSPRQEEKRVRALYDFEAAEDNELTFKTGEIIIVLDNSDQNWWKGENHRGVGLFPANFVTTDLSEPKKEKEDKEKKRKKKVRFNDGKGNTEKKASPTKSKPVISEDKLVQCLELLKTASPTEEDEEEEAIKESEEACRNMEPLIREKIEETERAKDNLEELNTKFLEALAMYQSLMREPVPAPAPVAAPPPAYTPSQSPYPVSQLPPYSQSMYQPQQMVRQQPQVPQQVYSTASSQVPVGPQGYPVGIPNPAQLPAQLPSLDSGFASQALAYREQPPVQMPPQQPQYYAGYPTPGSQEAYGPPSQGVVYDYGSPSHSRPPVMYSQAPVYQ